MKDRSSLTFLPGAVTGVISAPCVFAVIFFRFNALHKVIIHLITPTIFLFYKNPFNNIDEGGNEF